MNRLVLAIACSGSLALLGSTPSPQPAPSGVLPEASVLGGPPTAGPAPRLEMNAFRPQAYDVRAAGSVRVRIAFESKTLGLIWWKQSKVYVVPDNAYARWIVASFTVDPAVDRCCVRVTTTDAMGNAVIDHLAPGKYVLFGAYYTQTGTAKDQYAAYSGFDENGNIVNVSIPTLAFADTVYETIVTMTPFSVTAAAPAVTVEPTAIVDEVYR
jgi:hypothetical protein